MRAHFPTVKYGKPRKPTHYVFYDKMSGEIAVKTVQEFAMEGGFTRAWGKYWRAVKARSADEARQIEADRIAREGHLL